MDRPGQVGSGSQYSANAAHQTIGPRFNAQFPQSIDGRTTPRKPTPLQASETSTLAADDGAFHNLIDRTFQTATRSTSDTYSPPSPRPNIATSIDPPNPNQDLLPSQNRNINGDRSRMESRALRNTTASPPRVKSFNQLRNVSSPLPDLRPLGNSSPPSPRSTASPPLVTSALRPEFRSMPRTSSIDSAISTISVGTSHAHNASQDSLTPGMPDITNLINAAGSSEAVIQHLLKEKQHAAAQNAQLWKLVDKQRTLILGLNQDLDKALRDKERYRKKLKDHLESIPPLPNTVPKAQVLEPRGASPAVSEASAELPMQRQSLENAMSGGSLENGVTLMPLHDSDDVGEKAPGSAPPAGPEGTAHWVKDKASAGSSNHAHKQTSSSDIFGHTTRSRNVAPIQTRDLALQAQKKAIESAPATMQSPKPVVSPTSSFTAKRSQPHSAKTVNSPILALNEATSPGLDYERMTPPRKPPPAPLDLGQPKRESLIQQYYGPDDHSDSEYEDNVEVDELPALGRGRKTTREDDDREREAALLKQDRSGSKKEKGSKTPSETAKIKRGESDKAIQPQAVPLPPAVKALSPEPTLAGAATFLAPPGSLASVLNPVSTQIESSITQRTISAQPLSPGLPLSPRPSDRPTNAPTPRMPRDVVGTSVASPPLSPQNGFVGLPLSPRAPRQQIPLPHTPMSIAPASPMPPSMDPRKDAAMLPRDAHNPNKKPTSSLKPETDSQPTMSTNQSMQSPKPKGVFKGFMSEGYPDLLLSPNALPSIIVKVVSSRLKPSRHSLVLKGNDDEPVFTLGVSARYDQMDLWQVEKPILSLQQLDQQLRQSSGFSVKLPDRSLFNGHAPAKIDARRVALERYFEAVLDTQMDENAALVLCNYFSTHASEPSSFDASVPVSTRHSRPPVTHGPNGKLVKKGYLTKRGKNFGGWKARYFLLDEPVLKYFETPGGTLLGTIKLQFAQIGKQSQSKSSQSPSRNEDGEGQYRHAFLIREPKRKDSGSFMDHVLCAESDAERDAWVTALLCYVEGPGNSGKSKPPLIKSDSSSSRAALSTKKDSLKNGATLVDSPDSETFDSLQAVPYEDTKQAPAPHVLVMPDSLPAESPSPTTSGSQPSVRAPSAQSKAISGPQNGAKINDVGAWGNKPMASPLPYQKEQKKRSIWGFGNKNAPEMGANHPNGSNLSLTQQQYQEQITNVKAAFGAPLAEAVEYCGPHGIDVCLPAVVYRCLEYLEGKDAASEEGIFRMSGSNTLIKGLKSRFNAEGDFNLLTDGQYFDVHAVASLLKLYLRELPSMILTRELHMQFLNVLRLEETPGKVAAYNVLVHKLPKPNFALLRALSAFLIGIVNNAEVNLMNIRNVCIVFSPTLNIPSPAFSMFLTEFDAIFGDTPDDLIMPALEVPESKTSIAESPQRQMFSDIHDPSDAQDAFSSLSNQNPSYEQVLHDSHMNHDSGFTSLQSSNAYTQGQPGSFSIPDPDYYVRPRNLAPSSTAKARRRESSMLLMGSG